MVFNPAMDDKAHPDWALILDLGGPTKVAERLGLPKIGGAQRVQNWKQRGIPSFLKLEHPFLRDDARASQTGYTGPDRRKAAHG
jgi:hypothetical protein